MHSFGQQLRCRQEVGKYSALVRRVKLIQVNAAAQTMTIAFSQELLAPPDVNTAAGAWAQRFANGNQVLTDTGFGSWGAGFVEAVSGSSPITIQQTGHGYITGTTGHISRSTQSGVWSITA